MHRPEPNFNVAAQVIKQAEQNPSNAAIIFEGKTTTYGEFAMRVRKLAGLLRNRGVCVGDRVGFLGFNQPGFIETMFATISLGAVFVPLNFRLTGEELTFIIGGPDGICNNMKQAVHENISLSMMTLPHLLARILLLEQIYRDLSILINHPYHK